VAAIIVERLGIFFPVGKSPENHCNSLALPPKKKQIQKKNVQQKKQNKIQKIQVVQYLPTLRHFKSGGMPHLESHFGVAFGRF
jgi:hypothetical protein